MKEVVKREIIKWLDVEVIYPIADSEWVSPVQCAPKKGGMPIITNEDNELIPTLTITGWRTCIDYHMLNAVTKKDHFSYLYLIKCCICLLERSTTTFWMATLVITRSQLHRKSSIRPHLHVLMSRLPFLACHLGLPETF